MASTEVRLVFLLAQVNLKHISIPLRAQVYTPHIAQMMRDFHQNNHMSPKCRDTHLQTKHPAQLPPFNHVTRRLIYREMVNNSMSKRLVALSRRSSNTRFHRHSAMKCQRNISNMAPLHFTELKTQLTSRLCEYL